jgi:hypothetical protein
MATFAPGLSPAGLRQHSGLIPVYYEAAAVVTVLRIERFRAPQVAGDRAASNGAAS